MTTRPEPTSRPGTGARQIIVLGMHRSGTSALTGALAGMGVFVGDEADLTGKSWENPVGFFERRDARKICDTLLHASGADWWKVSNFTVDNAHHETVRAQRLAIRDLVAQLDEHGSWALKEPRLCLLLPIFQSALMNPLAIIALRHPVESARSLRRRNGFPMQAGLALWEAYMVSMLRAALAMDHVFVSFDELISTPHEVLETLAGELRSRGVTGLDVDAAAASIRSALRRERFDEEADRALLTPSQAALWKKLSGDRTFRTPPKLSNTAVTVLREFETDETARAQDRAALKSLTAQIAALRAAEAEGKAAEQQRLAKARGSERGELQTARQASAARDSRLLELEAAVAQARAAGADAELQLATLAAALEDLQRRHAERGRLLAQATRQLRIAQERQRALDNDALRAELAQEQA